MRPGAGRGRADAVGFRARRGRSGRGGVTWEKGGLSRAHGCLGAVSAGRRHGGAKRRQSGTVRMANKRNRATVRPSEGGERAR